MRISVGGTLTITGRRFKSTRTKNTVIFRARDGRTAFAKPRRATTRKLVADAFPPRSRASSRWPNSRQQPTRLKLRVLAGKFSKFTPKRLSPVVTTAGAGDGPGGGGGGGGNVAVCDNDADHDNDLLANSLELSIGTDPCLADTDSDQMTDGWEYWSAKDLNIKAVPYPGKRPFPNALDPSDGATGGCQLPATYDFDGDGLTTLEEYRAWRYTGSSLDTGSRRRWASSPRSATATARSSAARATSRRCRAGVSASYGHGEPDAAVPGDVQPRRATSVAYQDDERDADADGLSNFLEAARGPGHASLVGRLLEGRGAARSSPGRRSPTAASAPGDYTSVRSPTSTWPTRTSTATALLDGEDDQDNDDYNNITELYEVEYDLDGNGQVAATPPGAARIPAAIPTIDLGGVDYAINAFNPCAPDDGVAQLPAVHPLRISSPLPAVPPPTWRPHPRL